MNEKKGMKQLNKEFAKDEVRWKELVKCWDAIP